MGLGVTARWNATLAVLSVGGGVGPSVDWTCVLLHHSPHLSCPSVPQANSAVIATADDLAPFRSEATAVLAASRLRPRPPLSL